MSRVDDIARRHILEGQADRTSHDFAYLVRRVHELEGVAEGVVRFRIPGRPGQRISALRWVLERNAPLPSERNAEEWKHLAHQAGIAHSLLLHRAVELARDHGHPRPHDLDGLNPALAELVDLELHTRET